MSEPQLTFNALAQRLPRSALPVADPAPDLWPRIVARHRRAQRARRWRRFGGAAFAVVLAAAAVALQSWRAGDEVDWQARAQALELRLHAIEPGAVGARADATEAQLAQLDALLQAAYDNGADRNEVVALWKRRSELLDTLLRIRQRSPDINRT